MAYVRTVRTSSGAVAVQVVWKSSRGSRDIEHLGSAHTDAEVELLKAVAAQRIAAGQDPLPLDVAAPQEPAALEITSSRMGRLLDAIAAVYRQLGLDQALRRGCGVRAVGDGPDHRADQQTRRRPGAGRGRGAGLVVSDGETAAARYAEQAWRDRLSGACAAAAELGPSALILYDVTTLWFETDTGDGFREPGFSKERRLDPQITVGLAHRRDRDAVDDRRVRRQPGRDQDDHPAGAAVRRRARDRRGDRGRRRRHDERGQPGRDRGRRLELRDRREAARCAVCGQAVASGTTPTWSRPTAWC